MFRPPSGRTPSFSSTLHSQTFNHGPTHSTAAAQSTPPSSTGGPTPDTNYGRMPGGGGQDFVPPTPTYTTHSGSTRGGYNVNDNTITIDRGLSTGGRELVMEHETAHAAHATYLRLSTGDLSPEEAVDVAENLLLTELTAYRRQATRTLQMLDQGWNPIGRSEGSMKASAELYRDNPAEFYRMVLMRYAREYQGRFTGLDGPDGRPISLRRIAQHILSQFTG